MSNLVKLTTILEAQLGVSREEVKPNAKLSEDLGADSLDFTEIIMAVEEEWNTEIPDGIADELTTVGDILNLLEARGLE